MTSERDDRIEVTSPDDPVDVFECWRRVKTGDNRYNKGGFISLIKEAHPSQFPDLFGDLPEGAPFIERLQRFFTDHELNPGSLWTGGETQYLYVAPLSRNAEPLERLVAFARAEIAQLAALLHRQGEPDLARSLDDLRFEPGPASGGPFHDGPAASALEKAHDLVLLTGPEQPHWFYCLSEACYGIAADYVLEMWLTSHWRGSGADFEPAYRL
jgi:hypothetical protein